LRVVLNCLTADGDVQTRPNETKIYPEGRDAVMDQSIDMSTRLLHQEDFHQKQKYTSKVVHQSIIDSNITC